MATLGNLPYELQTAIFSHLPAADLARTCLVSHSVCNVVTPMLYRSPVLSGPRSRQRLKVFLLVLLTPGQEALATHVRSLHWCWFLTKSELCPRDEALLAPAAAHFGLRRYPNTQGSQFVMLIHLLPQLRILHITPPVSHSSFTKFMERGPTAPNTPRPLQSLVEFRTTWGKKRHGVTYKTLTALLALPCIRLIEVVIARSESGSDAPVAPPEAVSAVTHLRICDANPAPTYLGPLLSAAVRLTHFSYTVAGCKNSFALSEFWEDLRPLAASVVKLHLEIPLPLVAAPEELRGIVEGEVMWSFVQWTALRTLRCTAAAVVGREKGRAVGRLALVLPRGLKELELMADKNCVYETVVNEVVEVLAQMGDLVPFLERVAVRRALLPGDLAVLERLRGACEVAGVGVAEALSKW